MFRERGVVAETKGQPAVPVSHPAVFGDDSMADSFLSAFLFLREGYYMSPVKQLVNYAKELKSIYPLAAIAMLLALRVVLGIISNPTLPMFGNTIKISLAFLPIALAGAMFGPVPAALVGALGDVISFMIVPMGAYSPGFTISGALTGLIFGYALYKNQVTLPRVIIGWMINMLVVETFLAAYWLYIFPPNLPYAPTLISRFISVAIKCIPEILIIFGVGKLTSKLDTRIKKKKS